MLVLRACRRRHRRAFYLLMCWSVPHRSFTMDVGGTSFDIATIKAANAGTQRELKVNGYPILISTLDIRTDRRRWRQSCGYR